MAYAISEHMRNRINAAGTRSLAASSMQTEAPTATTKKKKKNKYGVLGGIGYTLGQLGTGIFGVHEGVYDFLVGGVADLFGADEYAKRLHKDDITGRWQQGLDDWYNPSKAMDFVGDVAGGLGQTGVYVGLSFIPHVGGAVSAAVMATSAAGRGTTAAYQKTGKLGGKEYLYGVGSGVTELALEKATGGVGKIAGAIKGTAKGAAKGASKSVAKSAVRSGVLKTMWDTGKGEFVEESLSEFIDPYLQRATIDPNAKNASAQEILRAGMVGFVSGAVGGVGGSTIGNARNVSAGSRITKTGNTDFTIQDRRTGERVASSGSRDAVLQRAQTLLSKIDNAQNAETVAGNLIALKGSYDAYNKLTNKDGIRGQMLLGEMARNIAYTELSGGVEASKADIKQHADTLAQYLTDQKGQTYTAEDIKNNKDGILTDLAIADFSAKMLIDPDTALTMVKRGESGVLDMASQYEAWRGNLTAEQLQEANTALGLDLNTATFQDFNKAMAEYNKNNQTPVQQQPSIETRKAQAQPMPDSISLQDGETAVYKTDSGEYLAVKKEAEGYLVAADDANGNGLGKSAKHLTEEQVNELVKGVKQGKQAPTETSKVKEVKAKMETAALTEEGRSMVKDFDNLPASTQARIREMISTGKQFNTVSQADMEFVANLMAKRSGVSFAFTDFGKDGANGLFTTTDKGKRFVQLNANNSSEAIRVAAVHELAHELRKSNAVGYESLSKTALKLLSKEELEEIKKAYTEHYKQKGEDTESKEFADLLDDEYQAHAMQKLFGKKQFLERYINYENKGILEQAKGVATKLANKFKGVFSPAYRQYDKLIKTYEAVLAMPSLAEVVVANVEEGAESEVTKLSLDKGNLDKATMLTKSDFEEANETHSKVKQMAEKSKGDLKYSIKFSKDISDNQLKWLDSHNSALSAKELKKAIAQTKEMVDIMSKYELILPEDKIGKTLVSNGSYDKSVENTTICVRTLAYNQFIDAVQEKIGRPLSQMESFLVSQKLYDIATEPQCLYCYVSLDRKAYNDFLLRYIKDRDAVIEKYNNSAKTQEDKNALYLEFLNGRKDTPNMRKRWSMWMNVADNGGRFITAQDVATDERRLESSKNKDLKLQLEDITKYAQSASWAKKQQNYVAYGNDILALNERVIKDLNKHYGLRWYSFSDYSGAFIVENMQQITDAALRGLKGLAYTKDTDFAKIFAPTGMNINISVYVKKINGEYQIDPAQSANIDEAIALRKKYPNVGIVVTATDTDGVNWALNQEWSDVVIPFHIVRSGQDVANFYNWELFNDSQSDTIDNQDLWQSYLDSIGKKKASKNIYPNEHKNDFATYKRLCDERGLKPRFSQFIENLNYMKLVNETRQTDDQTSVLTPTFDMNAAKQSFDKFVDKGGYYGGWYKNGISLESEVAQVAEDVLAGKKANEVSYGRQDIDVEALAKSRKAVRKHGAADTTRLSIKLGGENVGTNGKYTFDTDSAAVLQSIREQNDISNYLPKGLKTEFIRAIKNHGNFTFSRLYRGMEAAELESIKKNGYIKSKGDFNFDFQQGETFFSNDVREAFAYGTSFAPAAIREKFFEQGKPAYIVEVGNYADLNFKYNSVKESSTKKEVDVKYITRVLELRYNEADNKVYVKDISIDGMNEAQGEYIHGEPLFYKDKTTGTLLYAVQDEDGYENGTYISEAEPGIIVDYSKIEGAPDYEVEFRTKAAKISGKESDLVPYESETTRYSIPVKRVDPLINKVFPNYSESNRSDANERAMRWARRKDVKTRDEALVSYHRRYYIIEKFDSSAWGYQITKRVLVKDYNKYAKRIEVLNEEKRSGRVYSRAGLTFDRIGRNGNGNERQSSNSNLPTRTQPNRQVPSLATGGSSVRGSQESDGRNQAQSKANITGDFVRKSIPTKISYAPTGKTNIAMTTKEDKRAFRDRAREAYQKTRINFIDAQAAIADEFKRLGVDSGEALIQAARSATSKAQHAIGGNIVDITEFSKNGKEPTVLSKGVAKLMQPIEKAGLEAEFFDYLFNLHNIDRLKVDKPVNGNTAEESQKAIKEAEKAHPEFIEWQKEWAQMVDALMTLRLKAGLITQELYDELKARYPHYVPTFREEGKSSGTAGDILGKYDLSVKRTIKNAKGSTDTLLRPDEMIARQTLELYRAIEQNNLLNALYDAGASKGSTSLEIVSREKMRTSLEKTTTDNIADLETINEDKPNSATNTVTFFKDGEKITLRVSKNIFTGLEALHPGAMAMDEGWLLKGMRKVMNAFKSGVTNLNPFFLARNAARDIQDAIIYTKNDAGFLKAYPRACAEMAKNGNLWQLYVAAGGMSSSVFDSHKGFTGTLSDRGFAEVEGNIGKRVLQRIDTANLVVEQLPRFAEFIASIEAGKSIDQAILDSADVTVNFGRSGKITKWLNSYLIPFLNAAVQGASKTFRTFTGRKTAKEFCWLVGRCAILGIAPAVLSSIMYDDDEDYQNLRTEDKQNYYLFKAGDKFIKIPRGRLAALLSGVVVRTDLARKGEDDAFKGLGKSALETLTPVESASRSIFSPFADVKNNVTWYGTAIEGREFDNKAVKDRYDEGTSSIAIALGKLKLMQEAGMSPKKIHYLIDQYAGVLGDIFLPMTTKKAERNPLASNFTVDPITNNKLSTKFYKLYDETTYASSAGDSTAALKLRHFNKVKQGISDLYKQKDEIQSSKLSDKEKLARTRIIQTLINEAYKTAIDESELWTKAFADSEGLGTNYSVVEVTKSNYKKLEESKETIGSFVIAYNGKTTGKAYETEEKATKGLSSMISDFRFAEGYRLMGGTEQALAAYNTAAYEKAQKLNAAGIDYDSYYTAYMTLKQYSGDASEKREYAVSTIESLDLTKQQRLMLIYALGYSVKDGELWGLSSKAAKRVIANYIKGLRIKSEEKIALAKACGLTVKNGKIVVNS